MHLRESIAVTGLLPAPRISVAIIVSPFLTRITLQLTNVYCIVPIENFYTGEKTPCEYYPYRGKFGNLGHHSAFAKNLTSFDPQIIIALALGLWIQSGQFKGDLSLAVTT